MGMTPKTPAAELHLFQGVWFPTHMSCDGLPPEIFEPTFPTHRHLFLLTIVDEMFHCISNLNPEYYASGGRLRVFPDVGRLTLEYVQIPPEFYTPYAYRVSGDQLLLQSGGFPWSGKHDSVASIRYVRIAAKPTPEIAAVIENITHSWMWYWNPGR